MTRDNTQQLRKSNVSIYIPCFGYEKFISRAIESLKKQTFKEFHCEVYILKSDYEAKQIIGELIIDDNRFSLIELESKPTIQSLGNVVLKKCTSEYILRLDADDALDHYGLQILIEAANEDKMIAMVWGCFYYSSESGDLYNISPYKTILSDRNDPPHGACTLIRTSALRSISGYDETIKSQDGYDIWQRLRSIYKVKSLPQVIFYYTQHNNSLSKSKERMALSSNLLNKRKEKAFSGSLKNNILIVAGIKESYNPYIEKYIVPELQNNDKGQNKIQEIINFAGSFSKETNLVFSTTSQKVIEYCKNLKENQNSFLISLRKDDSTKNVPIVRILKHGLNEYMKVSNDLPSMIVFINTHLDLPTKDEINAGWLKLTCSSNSMYMPVENIRGIVMQKKSDKLEILNPGRFIDIFPAHEQLCKWKENFLCCTPDSILQDYLFNSVISE